MQIGKTKMMIQKTEQQTRRAAADIGNEKTQCTFSSTKC